MKDGAGRRGIMTREESGTPAGEWTMVRCPHCGTENRADASFCNACGFALRPVAPSASPAPAQSAGAPRSPGSTGRLTPQSTLRGRYLILQRVGQGGMAAVYQAHDLRTGVSVAVKEMSQEGLPPDELKEALDSFQSEARMLGRLSHPNLPRVYEAFEEQGRQYLVMDYIAGRTLEQVQRDRNGSALPEPEVLGWARQICDVLAYLHAQRPPIIFRDLKPANIMLSDAGQIKLIDFGIARVFTYGRNRDTQVLGTPGFAPPEQYGKAQTDPRADIYALGCTLYQLLTGYDPGTTPFNLPPLASRSPAVSPGVVRAIERATRLDRDQRYPTVAELRRELLAATPQASAKATTPPRPVVGAASAGTTYRAAHAAAGAPTARVVVQPYTVDFGTLLAGQRGALAITISGTGGGPVRGRITSLVPWIHLDREQFDGTSTVIQVIAETSQLPPGATGVQTTSLQVNCDTHAVFVQVRLDVAPVAARSAQQVAPKPPKGAKVTAVHPVVTAQQRAAPRTRPVPAKYAQPAMRRPRGVQMATSFVVGLTLAAAVAQAAERVLTQVHAPQIAPVGAGLLLLSAMVAALGAFAGNGGPGWPGRLRTTFTATGIGLLIALALFYATSAHGLDDLLARLALLPLPLVLGTQVAASAGAAIGADQLGSRWMLAIGRFSRRYANILVPLGMGVAGAIAGLVLTAGVLYGCLVPFAMIGGAWAGVVLARVVGFQVRPSRPRYRVPRPPRPRYYP